MAAVRIVLHLLPSLRVELDLLRGPAAEEAKVRRTLGLQEPFSSCARFPMHRMATRSASLTTRRDYGRESSAATLVKGSLTWSTSCTCSDWPRRRGNLQTAAEEPGGVPGSSCFAWSAGTLAGGWVSRC